MSGGALRPELRCGVCGRAADAGEATLIACMGAALCVDVDGWTCVGCEPDAAKRARSKKIAAAFVVALTGGAMPRIARSPALRETPRKK